MKNLASLFLLAIFSDVRFGLAYRNNFYDETTKNASNNLHYEYVLLEEKHPCARTCIQGEPPMICRYNFKMENYYTLTKACHDCPRNRTDCFRKDCIPADGNERGVIVVNRKMPGPAIEVCQGDLIIVDVENHLMSESTTIHWHGQHQKNTPYMDGVPFVTQCPILPRTTFRYTFRATQVGTHFWHSHVGMQRVDGCFGALIVRVPSENNPHDPSYDYDLSDHVMVLIDWEKETAMEKFLDHHHSNGDNKPATLLVNGLGRFRVFDGGENETVYTPLARFTVEEGYRYRFRVINAGFLNCPIEMSIDNHTLTVISTDGSDVAPVEADSLVTYAGERFDFVVSADQPKSLYWIKFRGLMDCDERFNSAYQVAVLEYKDSNYTKDKENGNINREELLPDGFPDYDSARREGKQINSLNKGTDVNNTELVTMPQLSSLQKWDYSLKRKPDYQIFLAYDFHKIDNIHFHAPGYEFYNVSQQTSQLLTPQLNHISMKMPSFPLLPQRDEIPEDMFCNENTIKGKECANTYCECPHAYQIPLNSVVELCIIDEGFSFDANHPLHLHGYAFRVVAMEKVGSNVTVEQVKERERKGLIKRNLLDPPIKDTVTVPDGGYTIVRFHATNPGYWIFHCHIEFHAEIGMALVFKVGENADMLPVPEGFPKCGSYLPEEKKEVEATTKPYCSKNAFVNKFEKVLFPNYCEDVTASSSKIILSSLLFSVLYTISIIFHYFLC